MQSDLVEGSQGPDYGALKDILEQDNSDYLDGVSNTDIDWFLRDSNINSTLLARDSASEDSGAKTKTEEEGSRRNLPSVTAHLQANNNSSNERNPTKSKPSVGPIQEETASPLDRSAMNEMTGQKRGKSATVGNKGSTGSGGGSFFSKFKDKFGHKTNEGKAKSSGGVAPKENLDLDLKRASTTLGSKLSGNTGNTQKGQCSSGLSDNLNLSRTMSSPNYTDRTSDPRLDQYIKFYQQKDLRRGSVSSSVSNGSSTLNEDILNCTSIESTPKNLLLHSALLNGPESSPYRNSRAQSGNNNSSGRFSSFLKRKYNVTQQLPSVSEATLMNRRCGNDFGAYKDFSDSDLELTPQLQTDLPEFSGLKPFKRVAFHSLTFALDPPQQIPSRAPRKGNVEVLPDGSIKINPLSEEDKLAIQKALSGCGGGLVVGGSGSLAAKDPSEHKEGSTNIESAKEYSLKKKSQKNSPTVDKSPPTSAQGGFASQDTSVEKNAEEEEAVDKHAKSLGIDKPMVQHKVHKYTQPVQKLALDTMYTRCCHLREILPIPAILKQIPPGSMAPIPVLQIRNPEPTMIEVQSFADFIRIAPIICISLDGVSLTLEQFRVLLSAMSAKTHLEKLSLRNTPIDQEGWSLLCWFLSRNKVLLRLDITQCPSLLVNLIKKKKKKLDATDKYADNVPRMVCNKDNRSDMDWALFTATIVARGGIEELILTGCCINDLYIFEKLITMAVLLKTSRLGLAYNNLTVKQFKVIVDHWLFNGYARGLDLGYNDLLSLQYVKILLDKKNSKDFDKLISNSLLAFLSFNSTNARYSDEFKEVLETVLMRFPCLKYLDLSNNPKLFGSGSSKSEDGNKDSVSDSPSSSTSHSQDSAISTVQASIIEFFTSKLPLFPKLVRLNMENNDFNTSSIVSLAQTLPFCKNLAYFSIIGSKVDLTAGSALVEGLKNTNCLIALNADYDNLPDFLRQSIGLYTMRNMERVLYSSKKAACKNANDNNKSNLSNLQSLTEQLNVILAKKADHKVDLQSPEVIQFVEKVRSIRTELREAINKLLKLQLRRELNLEGKETVIKFLFIDSTIEKGLHLIDGSLVDDVSAKQTSSFIARNSAEDEKSKYIIKDEVGDFQQQLVSSSPTIAPSRSPLSISRTSSKSSLLDKEEGSMMKLQKLHDYHNPTVDKDKLFYDFSGLSGDEIRKKILGINLGDVDEMIKYLSELKERGISLEKVFNMKKGKNDGETLLLLHTDEGLSVEEIKRKLKNLNPDNSDFLLKNDQSDQDNADANNCSAKGDDDASTSTLNQTNSDGADSDMNQVYDHVLNDFARLNPDE